MPIPVIAAVAKVGAKVAAKAGSKVAKMAKTAVKTAKANKAAGKEGIGDVGVGPDSIFPTGPGGNPCHYGTHIAMKGKQKVKTRRKSNAKRNRVR